MKIVRGAERLDIHWAACKVVELLNDGLINPYIDIQRGYVWKSNEKKSRLIRSMILDKAIPPFYVNKIDDVYEVEDGKQRMLTVQKFMGDKFALSGLDLIEVINDDGELEEVDINGLKFSELPDCFQKAIEMYTFVVATTDGADASEVADTFYDLNNGAALNSATMNRVKARSKEQMIRLGKHELFKEALSKTALEGHVNDDLVGRTHAILHEEEPCMNAAWIRKYMKTAIITEEDERQISDIYTRILAVHNLIEDKKVAKRIYGRTHMMSIVQMIQKSIEDNRTEEETMKWIVSFFCGKTSATNSQAYNMAAGGSGTGRKEAVRIRLDEVRKSYQTYFYDNR